VETTVTIYDNRKTGKTAAECKAFGKACRICDKVQHMTTMCFEGPTNIVVVTSDEEEVRNTNKKYEMSNTLDKILNKRGLKQALVTDKMTEYMMIKTRSSPSPSMSPPTL
jgi:hypothetical protein